MDRSYETREFETASTILVGEAKIVSFGLKMLLTKKIMTGEATISYDMPDERIKAIVPSAQESLIADAEYNLSDFESLSVGRSVFARGHIDAILTRYKTIEPIGDGRYLAINEDFEIRDGLMKNLPTNALAPAEAIMYIKTFDVLSPNLELELEYDNLDMDTATLNMEASILDYESCPRLRFDRLTEIVNYLQS